MRSCNVVAVRWRGKVTVIWLDFPFNPMKSNISSFRQLFTEWKWIDMTQSIFVRKRVAQSLCLTHYRVADDRLPYDDNHKKLNGQMGYVPSILFGFNKDLTGSTKLFILYAKGNDNGKGKTSYTTSVISMTSFRNRLSSKMYYWTNWEDLKLNFVAHSLSQIDCVFSFSEHCSRFPSVDKWHANCCGADFHVAYSAIVLYSIYTLQTRHRHVDEEIVMTMTRNFRL